MQNAKWNGEAFKRTAQNNGNKLLDWCLASVEADAKRIITEKIYNQPQRGRYKRTGMARSVIHGVPFYEKRYGLVGGKLHYLPYLELGTYKMKARPFLRPALDMLKLKLRKM